MFANLKAFALSLASDAETLFNRVTTKDQLDRVIASAVLIAYADGSCDPEEKQKAVKVVQAKLPHFQARDIADSWARAESVIDLGFDFGKPDLIKQISAAQGDEADLLLRVGILIGGADGDFDDNEKAIVKEMCKALGASPSDYGL
jgi:tellurite resistance protein TerB